MLGDNLPSVAAEFRGVEDTLTSTVVKVAECVEAFTYYRLHAPHCHSEEVLEYLRSKMCGELALAIRKFPAVAWGRLGHRWVDEAIAAL